MKRVFLDMDGVLCEYRADASMEDMERDGYFRALQPRTQMIDAVRRLIRDGLFEVFVLSAVLPQKADAVDAFSNENVLCDDHSPNLARRIASGGRGIKILNEVNGISGSFRDGPRVSVKTPTDLKDALAALEQIR